MQVKPASSEVSSHQLADILAQKANDQAAGKEGQIQKKQQKKSREIICSICYNSKTLQNFIMFSECKHIFCSECFEAHVQIKINQREQINCLSYKCRAILDKEAPCINKLSSKLRKKYFESLRETKYSHLRKCITRNCSQRINTNKRYNSAYIVCLECQAIICFKCNASWQSCKCLSEQQLLQRMKSQYKYGQCPNCGRIIEKTQGCNHMTCVCKKQFCYLCDGSWEYKGHLCPQNLKSRTMKRGALHPQIQIPSKFRLMATYGLLLFLGLIVVFAIAIVQIIITEAILLVMFAVYLFLVSIIKFNVQFLKMKPKCRVILIPFYPFLFLYICATFIFEACSWTSGQYAWWKPVYITIADQLQERLRSFMDL